MSPAQLKQLQTLSRIFSDGKATPEQIKQLSMLLAEINCNTQQVEQLDDINFTASTDLSVLNV